MNRIGWENDPLATNAAGEKTFTLTTTPLSDVGWVYITVPPWQTASRWDDALHEFVTYEMIPELFHPDDGSLLIEWVRANWRLGIAIENKIWDSSIYFISDAHKISISRFGIK